MIRNGHLAHDPLQFEDLLRGEHGFHRIDHRRGGPPRHVELLLEVRIADEHFEHEAILLGLGQRIGAFLLDGVLRGQHEERVGQLVPHAAHGDLPLLHRLEQRGLRLRGRAVDFVGQDHVAEQRAFEEAEIARARAAILLDHVGARDVGRHEVGGELDAAEGQVQRTAERADHQRFRQSRHAFEQTMPAAEQRNQQFVDHLGLADDDARQLLDDFPMCAAEQFDGGAGRELIMRHAVFLRTRGVQRW